MNIENIIANLNFVSMFWQLLAPLVFILADIITGFVQAVINNDVDTTKMRTGLLHKVLLLLLLGLGFVLDSTFGFNFCMKSIAIYIIIMELLSIFENLTKAGINLGKLSEILKVGRGEDNETK